MNSDLKKNYILFLVLSVLVIVGYSAIFTEAPKERKQEKIDRSTSTPSGKENFSEETGFLQKFPAEFEPVKDSYVPQIIRIKSDLYTAEIDTLGGKVVGWGLHKYKKTVETGSLPMEVITEGKNSYNTVLRIKTKKCRSRFRSPTMVIRVF